MDLRAMIIAGGADEGCEEFAPGVPIALMDVLGRSAVQRVVDRLKASGVETASVISEHARPARGFEDVKWISTGGAEPWRAAEKAFSEMAQGGAEIVITIRVGPYVEIDYEDLVQFHLSRGNRVTAVVQPTSEVAGVFVVNAARRNDASYLFRHALNIPRSPYSLYEFGGYINRLEDAADLRCLAVDAFCGNAKLQPEGEEIRPGVWAAQGASIHKRARVLAPCYIGAHARVRAAALITRCSALEHNTLIDCGTVVDNATVLPHTSIGAGLDVSHAVVGFKRLAHLGRQVEVEIADPKLVGTVSRAPVRLLGHVAALAAYLPTQLARGFAGRAKPVPEPSLVDTVQTPVLESASEEQVPANFVVARRYGNE
jgi:NDP-sugar pyrophosphorylase family protein